MAGTRTLSGCWGAAILLAGLFLVAGPRAGQAGEVTFALSGPNLSHLYPNAADACTGTQATGCLPAYYAQMTGFPQTLQDSIQRFTQSSLSRDGLNAGLSVAVTGTGAQVTLSSSDPAVLAKASGYAAMLPAFVDASHAGLGWAGVGACQAASGCWNPKPGAQPWAFDLPLGLPLVNQKAVMLLNYPPSDALCSADYLSNFTMARWTTVLQTVGIADPVLYETIVDVHPIAAPGSGQSTYIAGTTQYFFTAGQPNYDQAMLNLLLSPPGQSAGQTLPLQVAGSDALTAWQQITGIATVSPGMVGTYSVAGQPSIPWVATNHPDVTTYQKCPGDTGSKSGTATRGSSSAPTYDDNNLVGDELLDLQAACTLQTLANSPSTSPADALAACQKVWCTDNNGTCNVQAVCIQARMDYDFESSGNCKCQQAAAAFCAANNNNACPSTTSVTSCAPYNGVCGNQPSYATCSSLAPTGK